MRSLHIPFMALFLACFSSPLHSRTIHVPTDSTTIQAGIDGAANGDTVLVHPGTYVENIDFLGRAIVVRSKQGPATTIIDGDQAGSVVVFRNSEDVDSVLEGFTITNGSGTYYDSYWEYAGGGIYCEGAGPTIRYNTITDNAANNGGGIAAVFSSPAVIIHNDIFGNSANTTPGQIGGGGGLVVGFESHAEVSHNEIHNNYSHNAGGGMAFGFDCDPMVSNNIVMDNVANVYAGGIQIYSYTTGTFEGNTIMGNASHGINGAGGISCRLGSTPLIANNLIAENSAATYGGGIRCFNGAAPTIINNHIINNTSAISGGGIECDTGASATISNTLIWKNIAPAGTEMWIGPRGGSPAELTISYSNVCGGMGSVNVEPGSTLNWGNGMMDLDPQCRNPGADDFHLKAIACGDVVDSPCIDAGDPGVIDSILGCTQGLGTIRSDIGAYGGREETPLLSSESEDAILNPSLQLSQNYPNPFNPSTTIAFEVSGAMNDRRHVQVVVHDIRGRLVKTLIDSELAPGSHVVTWRGRDNQGWSVAAGVYFYTLNVNDQAFTRKMIITK
jgi:hypothetical protein